VLKPKALFPGLMAVLVAGFALGGEAIPNWSAPATWSPARSSGVHTMADITGPLPFIGVTPCRVADTRGNGFTGAYGPPSLVANANRTFAIGGQCGIPANAKAVSFNFGALNVGGAGDLRVFPAGAALPLVSTMNYNASTPNIANAAIVPLGSGAGITVRADAVLIDLIIDVNGYYGETPASGAGLILHTNTTGYTIEGFNSATACSGACGLYSQVDSNTAGTNAVYGNTTSSAAPNFATSGYAAGTQNSAGFDIFNSAGVYGQASHGTAAVNGVAGKVLSTSIFATGVYAEAQAAGANAMRFNNVGGAVSGYLGSVFSATAYGLVTNGRVLASNVTAPTLGTIAPDPADASKQISYLSVQAPTADIYFRGTAQLSNGYAKIDVPDHFRLTARGDSYMTTVTAVGSRVALYIESEGPDGIEVIGTGNGTFHYVVYAERDALRDHKPIEENSVYRPEMLAKGHTIDSLPAAMRADLIKNGTLNPDGTYNQSTAARLGWTVPPPETPTEPVRMTK
jgi:hypothetical protein